MPISNEEKYRLLRHNCDLHGSGWINYLLSRRPKEQEQILQDLQVYLVELKLLSKDTWFVQGLIHILTSDWP